MSNGEGTIEIDLAEFWEFVSRYHDHQSAQTFFGVPKVNKENHTIEIDYMYNTEINPSNEADFEISKCKTQWNDLK